MSLEPSALSRWLPTMLGALLAVGVVMAYELDVIEREPAPAPECESAPAPSKPERRRDPITAGARPRQTDDDDDGLSVDDKLARLTTQNALLADRNVTGDLAYFNLGKAELEAMARHCDVRSDYPKNLDPQESEDLGLSPDEREAWSRALQKVADQELELYRALLGEIDPNTAELVTMALAQVRRQLSKFATKARTGDDDSLQRHVAEERAGLRDAPEDPSQLSAWNRYNRLRFNSGDRFAELLVDELGADRVHELRSVFDGWPGARSRQWGCPGENTD
jgi:hypothetical protein